MHMVGGGSCEPGSAVSTWAASYLTHTCRKTVTSVYRIMLMECLRPCFSFLHGVVQNKGSYTVLKKITSVKPPPRSFSRWRTACPRGLRAEQGDSCVFPIPGACPLHTSPGTPMPWRFSLQTVQEAPKPLLYSISLMTVGLTESQALQVAESVNRERKTGPPLKQ